MAKTTERLKAGGFPVALPVAAVSEMLQKPAFITLDLVLVLRNAGPKGGPGMPGYGMPPIPDYLLGQGARDMVRTSGVQVSASYGGCVLQMASEARSGGPLAPVETGDHHHAGRRGRSALLDIPERTVP